MHLRCGYPRHLSRNINADNALRSAREVIREHDPRAAGNVEHDGVFFHSGGVKYEIYLFVALYHVGVPLGRHAVKERGNLFFVHASVSRNLCSYDTTRPRDYQYQQG